MSVQSAKINDRRTWRRESSLGAAILPSRAWILGIVVEPDARPRPAAVAGTPLQTSVQTPLQTALPLPRGSESTAVASECTCPDFCERDHANE